MSIEVPGCRGNTIRLLSGDYFDFVNPDPEMIRLSDISNALAMTCRYGGHVPNFYSVAEHSLNTASLACEDQCSFEEVLAVLLHDAAEAYIGDVVKPLKVMLPDFAKIEQSVEAAIEQRFGVSFKAYEGLIKQYDLEMLKAEKIQLFPYDRMEWFGMDGVRSRDVRLSYLGFEQARDLFHKTAVTALSACGRS